MKRNALPVVIAIFSSLLLIVLYIKVDVSNIVLRPNSGEIFLPPKATPLKINSGEVLHPPKATPLNATLVTTEEAKLWAALHKPQSNNTGFIHLYQQMITAGPYGGPRHQEIIDSIQYNIDHVHVKNIYMLEESGRERQVYKEKLKDPLLKVRFIPFGRQPNYSDVFETIMKHMYPNVQKNEVWMLANADIVLGEGLDMVRGNLDDKIILALSRHVRFCEDVNKCFKSGGGSTDCFVGIAEIKEKIYKRFNFFHYARGGENFIMWLLRKEGFTVINPCYDIKTYHNHCSKDRSWGKEKIGWTRADTPETRGFAPAIHWPYKKKH